MYLRICAVLICLPLAAQWKNLPSKGKTSL
jgi:hypothetical protein